MCTAEYPHSFAVMLFLTVLHGLCECSSLPELINGYDIVIDTGCSHLRQCLNFDMYAECMLALARCIININLLFVFNRNGKSMSTLHHLWYLDVIVVHSQFEEAENQNSDRLAFRPVSFLI